MAAVQVNLRVDPPQELPPELTIPLITLAEKIDQQARDWGSSGLAEIEIVVADDLAATVRSYSGKVIGVENLADYSLDRIGGVVAAKTFFRDEAHARGIAIFDRKELAYEIIPVHEFMHLILGRLRVEGGPVMPATSVPWEVGRWFTRFALEEFLADTLSTRALAQDASPPPDAGPHDFVVASWNTMLEMAEAIHEYRVSHEGLVEMWEFVAARTSQVLISLAHAQSDSDLLRGGEVATRQIDGMDPLDVLWTEYTVGMDAVLDAIPHGPQAFYAAELTFLEQMQPALSTFWESIGLTFESYPDGDYAIWVADPADCWPHADAT